ncbi:MAG: hypothetical protein LC797_03555 [Chloroflexi bacterium]|nr:hypothetical protein [Chloroflexota bacterium]
MIANRLDARCRFHHTDAQRLGHPSQALLNGAGTRQQRHLARQAVHADRVKTQGGADRPHGLTGAEADTDTQAERADHRQSAV